MIQSDCMGTAELVPPSIPDFSLLRRIGRGSYGDVWLARSVTGVYRAVKVVYRSRFDEDRPYEREFAGIRKFEPISVGQETQVSLFHVGRNDKEGFFYYVLELADDAETGEEIIPEKYVPKTLKEMRARQSRLPAMECVSIGVALTRALAHLHSHGLVHRDIKPSNVIFVHGVPKLADIGLISAVDASASFVGTEGFVPPEGPGSVQADIYSLGKVLYEIGTGRDRKDFPKLPDDIDGLADLRALLELNEVMLKACDSDVQRRYSSAEAMHEDLLLLQAGKSVKRLYQIERRFRMAAKYGVVATTAIVVAAAAFLWASDQARKAKENFALSERHRKAAVEALRESQLNHARAQRMTGLAGRRFETLQMLRDAAARQHEPESSNYRLSLRNEAIACLALPDLRPVKQWAKTPEWDSWGFDSQLRRYATNDDRGNLFIRDVETDRELIRLPTQGTFLTAAVPSPNDRYIATSDYNGRARIWDIEARKPTPIEFPKNASLAAFTPDSRSLVVRHENQSLHFLNANSGAEEKFLKGPFPNGAIWFSPNGKTFCSLSGPEVVIYDSANGALVTSLRHPGKINAVAWNPDSRRLATACGESIHFWDATANRELALADGPQSRVVGLEFDETGTLLASSSWDDITRLWHFDTHREVLESARAGNYLRVGKGTRRLAFQSWDHSQVELWELADGREVRRFNSTRRTYHSGFSPDGNLIHMDDSDGLFIFQPPLNQPLAVLPATSSSAAAFEPSGNSFITCGVEGLRLWPIERDAVSRDLRFGPPQSLGFAAATRVDYFSLSPDGRHLAARSEDGFRVLDPTQPAAIVHSHALGRPGSGPAISPDGRWVATSSRDKRLQIWDGRTGALITNFSSAGNLPNLFSPDNRWLLSATRGEYRFWETGTWKPGAIFRFPSNRARSCSAFTTDGKIVALTVSDSAVRLFIAGTDRELATLPTANLITHLCFSPDNTKLLMTYEPGSAELWDLGMIREELRELNLDWDQPAFAPPQQKQSLIASISVLTDPRPNDSARNSPPLSTNVATISLSGFYNGVLSDGWIPGFEMGQTHEHTLPLPLGINNYSGVPFEVEGVIQLSSQVLKGRGANFPDRVRGIPVGRRCQRLHFLHGTDWSVAKGTVIGTYTISFANGDEHLVPILYGQEVVDWWHNPNDGPIVAWKGESPASKRRGASIRVYRSTWENPSPDLEVRKLDFASTMTPCGPFLLGVTAE